jgi:hypothetical protein
MKFITHTILLPKEAQTEQPAQQPQQQVPTPHPVKQKQYSSQQIMDWSKSLDPLFQRMIARMLSQNDSQEVQTLNKAVAGDVQSRQWLMNKFNEFKSSQPAQQQNPNQQNPNQQNPNQQNPNQQNPNQQNPNQQNPNQQQDPNQATITEFTVQDPTNTKYGKLFADHMNAKLLDILQGDVKYGGRETLPEAILKLLDGNGGAGSLYESIHVSEGEDVMNKIRQQNSSDVAKLFPSLDSTDANAMEEAFKKYLFDNIGNTLSGTNMKFSATMSKSQENNMLWIRESQKDEEKDPYKHRIYINAKPIAALSVLKHVADVYAQFQQENPKIAPYVYLKAKIRANLSETDRADTCIVYPRVSKILSEAQIQQVIKRLEQHISTIPEQNLNGLVAGILPLVKNGITSVSDEVDAGEGESYTSQVRKSFSDAMGQIKPQAIAACQKSDFNNAKALVESAISQAVSDLQSKGYQ